MQKTLYIGNLPFRQEAGAVRRLVAGCGNVVQFTVVDSGEIIRLPGGSGGFAIAEMESEQDVAAAIDALHGRSFNGRTLTARIASAREQTAAGQPRMFSTMNMGDDPQTPPGV